MSRISVFRRTTRERSLRQQVTWGISGSTRVAYLECREVTGQTAVTWGISGSTRVAYLGGRG